MARWTQQRILKWARPHSVSFVTDFFQHVACAEHRTDGCKIFWIHARTGFDHPWNNHCHSNKTPISRSTSIWKTHDGNTIPWWIDERTKPKVPSHSFLIYTKWVPTMLLRFVFKLSLSEIESNQPPRFHFRPTSLPTAFVYFEHLLANIARSKMFCANKNHVRNVRSCTQRSLHLVFTYSRK